MVKPLLNYSSRKYSKESAKLRMIIEKRFNSRLTRILLEGVESISETYAALGLYSFPRSLEQELRDAIRQHYIRTARRFSRHFREFRSKDFKVSQVRLDDLIEEWVAGFYADLVRERIDGISASFDTRMRRLLDNLLSNEEIATLSPREQRAQLAKQIRKQGKKAAQGKANTVAATETTLAVEAGKRAEIESLIGAAEPEVFESRLQGLSEDDHVSIFMLRKPIMLVAPAVAVLVTKVWDATLDSKTRPAHAAAEHQEQDYPDPFDVGGEELDFPGDPDGSIGNTINCRCTTKYKID